MVTHYGRAVLRAARHGFRVGRPLQDPRALLRVAAGIVLGTALGCVLDQQMLCVGAWLAGLCAMVPHQRHRLGVSAASTVLLSVVGPTIGVFAHGIPWLVYVLAFLGVFSGGMLMAFGVGLGMRAIIMTVLTVALADLSPGVSTGLTVVKWLALGGALGWICQLLPPYDARFAGRRRAVAALYEALAAAARVHAEGGADHQPWPGPLLAARQSLTGLPRSARSTAAPLFALVGEAERIARYMRAVELSTDVASETRGAHFASAARVLASVASAVRSGRPPLATAGDASEGPVPAHSGDPHADILLRRLTEALTEAARLVRVRGGGPSDGAWQHTELSLLHTGPGFLVRGLRRLRAEFTWRSPVLRHALRLAAASTVAEAVGHATGDWGGLGEPNHAFWLFLTTAIVLFPTFEHTFSRGISRSAGAIAGGLIGWALALLPGDRALHYAVLIVLLFLYLAFRSTGQPLMIMWITAWVSCLGAGGSSAWTRTADTVIGAAIAMAVQLLTPTWHSDALPGLLSRWIRGEGLRLGTLAHAWADPATTDPALLERLGHEARTARQAFTEAAEHAESEPVHHLARWSGPELRLLCGAVHEVAKGAALLTARLPGPEMPGVPSAARYARRLHGLMAELATAAETGARPQGGLTARLHDVFGAEAADPGPPRHPGHDVPEVFARVTLRVEDLSSAVGGQSAGESRTSVRTAA
ncbi:FUSC family protein [Streptomyces sp. NPDC005573]|uniref:FUSC family protein n=1 Tax=Streptomyces sp. NPDC005573 TaxID=3156890 RepID=UPI00339EF0AD